MFWLVFTVTGLSELQRSVSFVQKVLIHREIFQPTSSTMVRHADPGSSHITRKGESVITDFIQRLRE